MFERALYCLLIILGLLILAPERSAAIEVSAAVPSGVTTGIDSYYQQGPALDHNERRAYHVGYKLALLPYLRLDSLLTYAPEDRRLTSTDVKFTEDYLILTPLLSGVYPYFVRFVAGVGPAVVQSMSELRFRGQGRSAQMTQVALQTRWGIEYAVRDCCEFGVSFGTIQRFSDKKFDWTYGFSYTHNIGPIVETSSDE